VIRYYLLDYVRIKATFLNYNLLLKLLQKSSSINHRYIVQYTCSGWNLAFLPVKNIQHLIMLSLANLKDSNYRGIKCLEYSLTQLSIRYHLNSLTEHLVLSL
jgi:hypothetical protein